MHRKRRKCRSVAGSLTFVLCYALFEQGNNNICEAMASAALGTVAGYDVEGGTDPICWNSTYLNASDVFATADRPDELDEEFDSLNAWLFANRYGMDVQMRAACYRGTWLRVSPLNPPEDSFFTDTLYTFRLQLNVTPSEIGTNGTLATQNGTAWFRLLLCDVVRGGFCNPLYNTRETEDFLTKADTDVGGSEEIQFSDDPTYTYTPGTALVGVKQEKHIFSRFVRWSLSEVGDGSGRMNATVDIDFVLPYGQEGVYYFIGHATVFFQTDDDPTSLRRVDVADAIPTNAARYENRPEILELTTAFMIVMCVVLGVALVLESLMLYFVIHYRNHTVLKLAQAPFLAMLMGCAIFTTGSCYLLLEFSDLTCKLFGPMILVPITMMAAILAGRLWRAYSMLSVALNLGKTREPSKGGERLIIFLAHLVDWRFTDCCKCFMESGAIRRKTTTPGLRTVVTNRDVLRLITILTLPQILLQVLSSVLMDRSVQIEYDSEGDVGRLVCGGDEWWLPILGIAYVGLMFVCLMVVAWMSRDLPSLFNEKSAIFKACTLSGVISFLGATLLVLTQDATTSPNVTVFLWIFVVLSIVLALSWFVVMPKIRRIRSGEQIVVSHLLAAHRSELERRYSASTQLRHPSQIQIRAQDENRNGSNAGCNGRSEEALGLNASVRVSSLSLDQEPTEGIEDIAGIKADDSFRQPNAIVLRKSDPPPRAIETHILRMKELITKVSSTSLEGRHIPLQDWQDLKKSTTALNEHLDRLEFSWGEEEEEQQDDT